MGAFLDDIATLLAARFPSDLVYKTSDGTQNLMLSRMIDEGPNTMVALYEYPGPQPQHYLGGGAAPIDQPRLQVLVRASSYSAARSLLQKIQSFLDAVGEVTVNGTRYLRIMRSDSGMTELQADSRDRQKLTTNFMVWKEVTADG